MIFGRRRKASDVDVAQSDEEEVDLAEVAEESDDTSEEEPEAQETPAVAGRTDEWSDLDASKDWREEGPFDADEVDLEGDDVDRLDFGPLIVTPSEDVGLQLKVEQDTNVVQALLATHGESGLEITLFAAPVHSSMLPEVRRGISESVEEAGGTSSVEEGPFGAELHQVIPVTGPKGEKLVNQGHIWLVEGPGWLLRGTLMGRAATEDDPHDSGEVLLEFFRNLVVTRDDRPRVPGDLIRLTLPEELVPAPDATAGSTHEA